MTSEVTQNLKPVNCKGITENGKMYVVIPFGRETNEKRYGAPWAAYVSYDMIQADYRFQEGAYNYKDEEFKVFVPALPCVIAVGQKDHRSGNSTRHYVMLVTGEGVYYVDKKEAKDYLNAVKEEMEAAKASSPSIDALKARKAELEAELQAIEEQIRVAEEMGAETGDEIVVLSELQRTLDISRYDLYKMLKPVSDLIKTVIIAGKKKNVINRSSLIGVVF